MRRTSPRLQRPYRAYDPLTEVESERLKLIGAISLAWNWIEGGIDASLAVALQVHPSMWNDVTTRINGLDGKFALLQKFATLYLSDVSETVDDGRDRMKATIGQISAIKKLRDGVIHVRLTAPEEMTGDIPVGQGKLHEVLVSADALQGLYRLTAHLGREMDAVMSLFYWQWLVTHASGEDKRRQAAIDFRESLAQLRLLQQERATFPQLPEFPESPPAQPDPEAAQELPG